MKQLLIAGLLAFGSICPHGNLCVVAPFVTGNNLGAYVQLLMKQHVCSTVRSNGDGQAVFVTWPMHNGDCYLADAPTPK